MCRVYQAPRGAQPLPGRYELVPECPHGLRWHCPTPLDAARAVPLSSKGQVASVVLEEPTHPEPAAAAPAMDTRVSQDQLLALSETPDAARPHDPAAADQFPHWWWCPLEEELTRLRNFHPQSSRFKKEARRSTHDAAAADVSPAPALS